MILITPAVRDDVGRMSKRLCIPEDVLSSDGVADENQAHGNDYAERENRHDENEAQVNSAPLHSVIFALAGEACQEGGRGRKTKYWPSWATSL